MYVSRVKMFYVSSMITIIDDGDKANFADVNVYAYVHTCTLNAC